MKPAKIPKWLLEQEKMTAREWKQKKRRELHEVIKLANHLRIGCAYAPYVDGKSVGQLLNGLDEFARAWSQKEWGK